MATWRICWRWPGSRAAAIRDNSARISSVNGTLGNPQGAGTLVVTKGVIQGQPFDRAQAQVNLSRPVGHCAERICSTGSRRVNLTGEFRHPRDSFTTGQLRAAIQSGQINLAQVSALQKRWPILRGRRRNLTPTSLPIWRDQFQLTSVNGNASVRGTPVRRPELWRPHGHMPPPAARR